MKERLFMRKRKFKNGFTLIEILVAVFILGCVFGTIYFMILRMYEINTKNKERLDEEIFLNNTYNMFISDPINFEENLKLAYTVELFDDMYKISNLKEIMVNVIENEEYIFVYIIKEKEVIEEWIRKKEIP